MGAVAVGVDVGAADGVVAVGAAVAELRVRRQETGVHDVGVGAGARRAVVDVVGRAAAAVRDRPETVGRARLRHQGSLRE